MLREEKAHSSLVVSRNGKLDRSSACKKQLASFYTSRKGPFGPSLRPFIRVHTGLASGGFIKDMENMMPVRMHRLRESFNINMFLERKTNIQHDVLKFFYCWDCRGKSHVLTVMLGPQCEHKGMLDCPLCLPGFYHFYNVRPAGCIFTTLL